MQDFELITGKHHTYSVTVAWTGNLGFGTPSYTGYDRNHTISAAAKTPIAGSSDPAFRGDATRWNPEELLLASISACHKLWYLHLCAEAGISVTLYRDEAVGTMVAGPAGGRFVSATLRPQVGIQAEGDVERAKRLHHDAHTRCFIANSVNFPISCHPEITAGTTANIS